METASSFVAQIYDLLAFFGYKHPVHPILVHITMGLVVAALVFAFISLLPNYNKYSTTARHCITFAFISAIPTMLVGLMDWVHYYGGNLSQLFKMKITLAITLITVLGITSYIHGKLSLRSIILHIAYLTAFANIVMLGFYGGELIHASATSHSSAASSQTEEEGIPDQVTYTQVKALLQNNCVHCHSRHNNLGGLQLDSYDAIMQGGDSGSVIEPGAPDDSLMIRLVEGKEEPLMPLGGPQLPQNDIDMLRKWVEQGARE